MIVRMHLDDILHIQYLSCLANIDINMLPINLKAAFAIDIPLLKPHFTFLWDYVRYMSMKAEPTA